MNNVNFINSFAKYCKENYKTLSKMIISFQLFLIGAFFIAIRSSMLLYGFWYCAVDFIYSC